MRTKNELYQEALRTVAVRRQTARGCAGAEIHLQAVPGHRHGQWPHLHLCL